MEYGDLVQRDGIYYKKFTEVPFSGEAMGRTQRSIKKGRRDGPWIAYYRNGQLRYKGDYKSGLREGAWIMYHNNGQLEWKGNLKNGEKAH